MDRTNKRPLICMLFVIVAFARTAVAEGERIPSVLEHDGEVFWVAADEAVTKDGQLNPKLLGRFLSELTEFKKHERARRSRELPSPAIYPELEGCDSYLGTMVDHYKPTSSLTDLTTHAEDIVSGRVLAMRQGFLGGLPGSLLLLSADYLKGNISTQTYLFYPLARINDGRRADLRNAGRAFCTALHWRSCPSFRHGRRALDRGTDRLSREHSP